MRMSRASAYAIGAVLQLGDTSPGVPIPCSRLAKNGEMPERFLLQVLRNLVNHGLLKSTRGVEGGYALRRPLAEISLLDIFEATDGPMTPVVPPLDSLPTDSRERLLRQLADVTRQTCQSFATVKLAELLPQKENASTVIVE